MLSKDTLIQREAQRAQEEAHNQSSFIKSKYNLYVLAQVMLIGGMIISAATEGWHLTNKFNSIAIAGVGVILIEAISIVMGNMVVNDIRGGIMSASSIAKSMFGFALILYIGATYFSISLTLDGAPDFYEYQRSQTAPPPQVSIDSINQVYAEALAEIDANIKAQENTTWKGNITSQANKNINSLLSSKQGKEAERLAALAEAKATNTTAQEEWEADLAEDQKIVVGFAGLGEVVKIFAIIFIALFKEGRNQELGIHAVERKLGVDIDGDGAIGKPTDATRPPGFYPATAGTEEKMESPAPSPRRPIGFYPSAPATTEADTSVHDAHSVATCSYTPVATEMEDGDPIEVIQSFGFYKDARKNLASWKNSNRHTAETIQKNTQKYEERMTYALNEIERRGYTVQISHKKIQLVKK